MRNAKEVIVQAIAGSIGASLGVLIYAWIRVPKTRSMTMEYLRALHSVRPTKVDAAMLSIEAIGLAFLIKRLRWLKKLTREEWEFYSARGRKSQ